MKELHGFSRHPRTFIQHFLWAHDASEKLTKKSLTNLEALFDAMPFEKCEYAKARLKSCSGVGAQWLAQTPTCHLTQLTDEDMCSAHRLRLGLPTQSISICPHINSEGRVCGKECDSEGRHLLSCASGGGFFVGHDNFCAAYCHLASGTDGIPGVEADWKPHVAVWPRATRGAEADVGFYRIPGCRDIYVDAVGSLVNPATHPSCAQTAGFVAELKARAKNADHPVFDAQTRRRMYTFDFCALSFERHGYLAKETVSFTKKLAFCRATALGLEPSAEIRRWYGVIACCIQRANAKILRGEPVPARSSNPPPRLFARGRDLALVGA